ncbi:MAG TPA: phosphatidate cytidylyltransferase, partial [Pseudogracilibacillus sp.]|nr:phosphatidate cytidylyltransferase [Pseudogracilibacillus sp.]
VFLVVLLGATVFTKNQFTFDQAGFIFLATVYIGTAFYVLIESRMLGLNYLLFILFVIWATDSGAYFVGKSLGKRKLWPEISPNKTIGGALGGIVTAIVVGAIFHAIYPFDLSWVSLILVVVIISLVGQVGDLVASAVKRHFNVKDSGKLFPGHGGILDRLDSLMFVLIVLHIIQFV